MKYAILRLQDLETRVAPAIFTVTTLADSGPGSLRDALAKADTEPGPDKVVFKLPTPVAQGLRSSDKIGAHPKSDPISPGELAATLFWRFGLDPATKLHDPHYGRIR